MSETSTERRTGHLKHYNSDRGYGFIGRDDGERDLFVHISGFQNIAKEKVRLITPHEQLTFEIGDNRGRPCAVNVMIEN